MQSLIWLRPLIQCCNDSCVLGIGILLGFVFDLLHELVELPYLLITHLINLSLLHFRVLPRISFKHLAVLLPF